MHQHGKSAKFLWGHQTVIEETCERGRIEHYGRDLGNEYRA
jgi:hypothetical protein